MWNTILLMPYWCPSYWLPVVCNMKYTTWLPVVCKPGTSTAHPSRNSNSSNTNTFLRINIYTYIQYVQHIYVHDEIYTYYMWTQRSFLRTLGSIIIFNKNVNFGKNSIFRNFENRENIAFFGWGPQRALWGPQGTTGLLFANRTLLLIGSPTCSALSSLQTWITPIWIQRK